jgi:hypothetical protein
MPMRAPDYTVAHSRPECLNRLTSPPADSFYSWLAGLLKARQTASRVTAHARPNDYLSAIGPAAYGTYENRAL